MMYNKIKTEIINSAKITADFLNNRGIISPQIAIVLGSGLSIFDKLDNSITIKYSDIPSFPQSTVEGHKGELCFGNLENIPIIILRGRFHIYEGYYWDEIIYPFVVLYQLGVKTLIVTNSAGGINRKFNVGDLMVIDNHINLLPIDEEERFRFYTKDIVKFNSYYDPELINLIFDIAKEENIYLQKGTYTCCSGPSYETPAEIRMLEKLGADAVGMSTVPEVIISKILGLKVLAISCITNVTDSSLSQSKISHEEVVAVAKKVSQKIEILLQKFLKKL